MTLELTAKCNFRCPYCYCRGRAARGGELDAAGWKAVLDRCAADGVDDVLFSGGEALLRGDLLEIVRYARRRLPSARLSLFTNASRLTEELIRTFRRLRVRLATSLQGLSTYGAMTGTRRRCGGLLAVIARAAELKWPVAVSMTVTSANKAEAPDMFAAAALMGAKSILMGPVMADGGALEHPELMVSRREWEQVKARVRALPDAHVPYSFCDEFVCTCRGDLPAAVVRRWRPARPAPCAAGRSFGVVGPDGRYRRCLHASPNEEVCQW